MTAEQFLYWLVGYLSGGADNDIDSIIIDIKQALKQTIVNYEINLDE